VQAMSKMKEQEHLFDDEKMGPALPLEEEPEYCRPSPDEISAANQDEPNVANVRMVVKKRPRIVHAFAASLFYFSRVEA
jgi:hypothetical protein